MIKVRFFSKIRLITRTDSIEMDAIRVDELLSKISTQYEGIEVGELRNSIIFVNGTNITDLRLFRTKLQAGDEVVLFSPVAGG